jgi:acetyl-CoA C-acetyltransferase/acetyl-CoA acyltransferase
MSRSSLPPIAVLGGARTPFAKAFGALGNVPADQLGRIALDAALSRTSLPPTSIEEVIFGNVAGQADASNLSRVIALRSGIPADRIAHTVNRNCASGLESIIAAWHVMAEGRASTLVAGGTESMSTVPFLWNPRAKDWLVRWRRSGFWHKVVLLRYLRPAMLKPVPALELGLTDPICGLNMGQTAELLSQEFGITREEQDQFALTSHQKAVAAWKRGFFTDEVVAVPPELTGGDTLSNDTVPRPNQTMEALARLPPLFNRANGTITAGNSCPLTDGAAALILRPAHDTGGSTPLGYLKDYAIAGLDPRRMGLGPVFAIHKLLKKTGLKLSDFDLVEINEAFAAQVLACQNALASTEFARRELNSLQPVGELDPSKLNVNGGAIALGHPVGASGTRLVLTLLRALRERGLKRGLASLCVGGGQGVAIWVERDGQEV